MKNMMSYLLTSLACVAGGGGQGLDEGKNTLLFSVITLDHPKHDTRMSDTGRILYHAKEVQLSLKLRL